MSDGPSDCARLAYRRAVDFAKEKYPKAKEVMREKDVPKKGDAFIADEDWLDHTLTIYRNGAAIHRYKVPPYGDIKIIHRVEKHPKMRHYCG